MERLRLVASRRASRQTPRKLRLRSRLSLAIPLIGPSNAKPRARARCRSGPASPFIVTRTQPCGSRAMIAVRLPCACHAARPGGRMRRAPPRMRRAAARRRGSGFLGPAPPAGTARSVAHSAIRFLTDVDYPPFDYCRSGRQPGRLQCRSCAADLRGDQGHLHHPGAAASTRLLDALNDNRGDAVIASIAPTRARAPRRFHRPLLPHAGAFRRPRSTARSARCCRSGLRARRSPWWPAPRTRHISKPCSPRPKCGPTPMRKRRAKRCARRDVDCLFGDGIALAFWLNGSDSAGCCAFRGGPFMESRYFGEGIGIAVKRGNDLLRHGAQLGAVPIVGKGQLHRSVAALFSDQPVLTDRDLCDSGHGDCTMPSAVMTDNAAELRTFAEQSQRLAVRGGAQDRRAAEQAAEGRR